MDQFMSWLYQLTGFTGSQIVTMCAAIIIGTLVSISVALLALAWLGRRTARKLLVDVRLQADVIAKSFARGFIRTYQPRKKDAVVEIRSATNFMADAVRLALVRSFETARVQHWHAIPKVLNPNSRSTTLIGTAINVLGGSDPFRASGVVFRADLTHPWDRADFALVVGRAAMSQADKYSCEYSARINSRFEVELYDPETNLPLS